jgi:hypothetical protein
MIYMRHKCVALLVLTALGLTGSAADYENAKQKLDRIANDEATRGSTTALTTAEVNALVSGEIESRGLEGVREPKVDLGADKGTWSGIVNFEKLPQLESLRSNFLLRSVLKGESPISATLSLKSAGGKATVDVERVSVGETVFEGSTLGFLVQKVILSDYPEVELGEPFDLEHEVEYIKLAPDGIRIKIKD